MPGALDPNGVFIYAEDDPIAPWSTYMNKGQQSVSDVVAGIGTWTAYTPTLGGITLGNGSAQGSYSRAGKIIAAHFDFVLGSTSAITGEVSFTLPVTAKYVRKTGTATGRVTAGGSPFALSCWSASSTSVQLIRYLGTNGLLTTITATAPGTWASGGWIEADITYEAAS